MKPRRIVLTMAVAALLPLVAAARAFADPAPPPPAAIGGRVAAINNTRVAATPKPSDFARPGDDRAGSVAVNLGLPDLTLIGPLAGAETCIVGVANRGSRDAGPFVVGVLSGGQSFRIAFPSGLPANSVKFVPISDLPYRAGARIVVDGQFEVHESDEGNNALVFPGTC